MRDLRPSSDRTQADLHRRATPTRLAVLASAAVLFLSEQALAQQAPPQPASASDTQTGASIGAEPPAASDATNQDIVVTASRISRDGYTAPTPTTVVSQEFVQQRAITISAMR